MNWDKFLSKGRLKPSSKTFDDEIRNDFESDFGRVIFSPAIRRMHDKTQVFPLTTDDHIHSRLTHSMEVMAIGYSLGVRVCADASFVSETGQTKEQLLRAIPIILKNACLVHDIGNPPFGHFGETVIQNYFEKLFENSIVVDKKEDITPEIKKKATENNKRIFIMSQKEIDDFKNYDGNAQGFRILTKLQALSNAYGLNLTHATLGAFLKYPNADNVDGASLSTSKRGVFQPEREYLEKIVDACGLKDSQGKNMRHPLAFLMEAADSICYLTMDIEDGFNKGWYGFEDLEKHLKLKVDSDGKLSNEPEILDVELLKTLEGINIKVYDYGREISKMVDLRIYLIERLVGITIENFFKHLPEIYEGKYNKELIKDDSLKLTKKLSIFCGKHIFPKKEILSLELTGHAVLTGLMDYYIEFIFHEEEKYRNRAIGMISNSIYRTVQMENKIPENDKDITKLTDYSKLRIIVDFITGMTDQFALDHYQKLSGQKII